MRQSSQRGRPVASGLVRGYQGPDGAQFPRLPTRNSRVSGAPFASASATAPLSAWITILPDLKLATRLAAPSAAGILGVDASQPQAAPRHQPGAPSESAGNGRLSWNDLRPGAPGIVSVRCSGGVWQVHIILVSDRLATADVRHHPRFRPRRSRFLAHDVHFRAVLVAVGAVPPALPRKPGPFGAPRPGNGASGICARNLNAMATALGEMQAQLLRLDSLNERVSTFPASRAQNSPLPAGAQGGPLLLAQPRTPLTNSTTRCRGSASIVDARAIR